jgi:hypothetical protein
VSPTRILSGDPFVERLVLRCWDVERDAGLDGILEFVDKDLRPTLLVLFRPLFERVGDERLVPSETRGGGRVSLLPGPANPEGRPSGVGVEYIIQLIKYVYAESVVYDFHDLVLRVFWS